MGITGAVIAGISLVEGVKNSEQAKHRQQKALANQDAAQQQAQAAAVSERRRAEMAMAAANRKQPDVMGLLDFEQNMPSGAAQTNLQSRKRGGLLGDV